MEVVNNTHKQKKEFELSFISVFLTNNLESTTTR